MWGAPARLAAGLMQVITLLLGATGSWAAETCTKADIAAVIDATGAELRRLNAVHRPELQSKLDRLARRRGWNDVDAKAKAAELLQDDETRALDDHASELLGELDALGDESVSDHESCRARLEKLRTISAQLVEVTTAKAAHVSARLEAMMTTEGSPRLPSRSDQPGTAPEPRVASKPDSTGEARPAASARPGVAERGTGKMPPQSRAWETDTVRQPPATGEQAVPAPGGGATIADLTPRIAEPAEHEFTVDEISAAGRGFFGSISASLAGVIEYAFRNYGRPNGYILGTEGGAALLAGVRYGDGQLVTKLEGERKVYWQGPSVGYDFGLAGSRVMILVYNLRESNDLFARFGGVDGSAYLLGGVGVTFLKKGKVVLAPIRTGLGLRVGANVGYLKFTPKARINPF